MWENALRGWIKQLEAERDGLTSSSKTLTPKQYRIQEIEE
tara:strand:+ start:1223 stop:1342 length:120 start_codon:yes stop_codon:yes gene_type:complete